VLFCFVTPCAVHERSCRTVRVQIPVSNCRESDTLQSAGKAPRRNRSNVARGDRHGQIIDPFGHRWGLSKHVRDVPPDEIARAAAEAFGG
jgi:hypothetical protein